MLSLVLEIINSVLTHRLKNNIQLVYALLLKREIFVPLRTHPRLADLVKNIEQAIDHFSARLSEANIKAPSTNEILELLEQSARTWVPNRMEVCILFQDELWLTDEKYPTVATGSQISV